MNRCTEKPKLITARRVQYAYAAACVALLVLSLVGRSFFAIWTAAVAAAAQLLFCAVRRLGRKPPDARQVLCKPVGWIVMSFGAAQILLSVRVVYFIEGTPPVVVSVLLTVTSAVMILLSVVRLIFLRGRETIIARFSRFILWAMMTAPAAIIVRSMLLVFSPDTARDMTCLSGSIFGVVAALIGVDMIIISLCGYCRTREGIAAVNESFKSHKWLFTRASLLKDAVMVIVKSALSIISHSLFMFVNALYSLGLGLAKYIAIRMKGKPRGEQLRRFRFVGIVILVTSVCYVLYSSRMFFGASAGRYTMIVAIVIAGYTFVEFFLNIRAYVRLRSCNDPESEALKLISLASNLILFVITQTAIMSFTAGNEAATLAAGIGGICFGGLAALVGVYTIVRGWLLGRRSQ